MCFCRNNGVLFIGGEGKGHRIVSCAKAQLRHAVSGQFIDCHTDRYHKAEEHDGETVALRDDRAAAFLHDVFDRLGRHVTLEHLDLLQPEAFEVLAGQVLTGLHCNKALAPFIDAVAFTGGVDYNETRHLT